MPGAARLRHELEQASVLENEIMRGNLRGGVAKPPQGGLARRYSGVMKDDRVRRSAVALAWFGEGSTVAAIDVSGFNSGNFQ